MVPVEYYLTVASGLLLISILFSKASGRLGIPGFLIFILVGMLAGEDGPGRIQFNNPWMAQSLGVIALALILFSGGLSTDWQYVKPVWRKAASLATVGVLVSTFSLGAFAAWFLNLGWVEGMLLGAIVSSTDAAAVFSVLRARSANLKGNLRPLLELESGSNDPMAVLATVGAIEWLMNPAATAGHLGLQFAKQLLLGGALGYAFGRGALLLINRLKLDHEGLYPVLTLTLILLLYGVTTLLGGSGFLAVYLAGLVLGNHAFTHKKSLVHFHDGLAWLMQIAMFLVLGLLVAPRNLIPIAPAALAISLFLIFVARPLSVWLSLPVSDLSARERLLVSWVGLRGAVPIVLATFPLLAGYANAELFFNLVFFIVLTSSLLQATSIPAVARLLRLEAPAESGRRLPLEFERPEGTDTELLDFIIPYGGSAVGKSILDLGLPKDSLITLVCRDEKFLVPGGGTILQEGDVIMVLTNAESLAETRRALTEVREDEETAGEEV